MSKLLAAMILLLAVNALVVAQENGKLCPGVVLPNTEVRILHSNVVAVDYKLYVNLPKSYQDSSKAYPVVYMLDADYSFALAKNIDETHNSIFPFGLTRGLRLVYGIGSWMKQD